MFAVALLAVATVGCEEWLSVDPVDQILEDQVFRDEGNIQRALNGIYLRMGENSLYGMNMGFYAPELLAQTYHIPASIKSNSTQGQIASYAYTESGVSSVFNNLWFANYNLILEINLFIKKMEATGKGVISDSRRNLLSGEAYALRAFMHFDLLRLFGPVYAHTPDAPSIPYYTKPGNEWQPRKKASEIVTLILADIETALTGLAADPVLTEGVSKAEYDFYAWRNRRMNYYAVQTLKARVLLYKGATAEAGAIARDLIEKSALPEKFPWTTTEAVMDKKAPDRIFSDEVLFGVHVQNMYQNRDAWFSANSFSEESILGVAKGNMEYMFEANYSLSPDYRILSWEAFKNPEYYLSTKFLKPATTVDFSYFLPLIRKSELYLIAAETTGEASWVDAIRTHRSLKTLADEFGATYDLQQQIGKEYFKETFGEGQYFFYLKRLNKQQIRNMDGSGDQITMDAAKYAVPLPEKELNH